MSRNRMSCADLRFAMRRDQVEQVELHGLRCCGYSAWIVDRSGRRAAFTEGGRTIWNDQGSLKRLLRGCGVREVYWCQPVSHDEMIGRPSCLEPEPGLRLPLYAND